MKNNYLLEINANQGWSLSLVPEIANYRGQFWKFSWKLDASINKWTKIYFGIVTNSTNKFKIQEIKIENNFILSERELLKNLSFLYEKEIFFLKTKDIEKKLKQNSFIKWFKIKKIYPNKIIVYVIEKDPIAIIIINNNKFFLGKKFDLIKFYEIPKFKKLPTVYGDNESFKFCCST